MEALIDLHVVPAKGLDYEALRRAFEQKDFGYYFKNPISQGTLEAKLTPDGRMDTTGSGEQIGMRLHSMDDRYVAQCRVAGFTISRLPPYEKWEDLIAETKRIWQEYRQAVAPLRVTRIATRFINNLRLPMDPGASFQRYLKKFVDLPDGVPQGVSSFFQRFQVVEPDSPIKVNLTVAMDKASPEIPTPVFLDIDAFLQTNLDPASEELWALLESLHAVKNRCFFGSLEEEAVRLYE